jgi:2-polyprenyl-6-methoxyphenol hydroxylase-like FAD-dependent oxidoreductase
MDTEYDVVVVGARVAGAATAMLLARAGVGVLAVDRARFPSDTLSTHQVQLPGVACLHRWGLLEKVAASGCPPTRRVRFDTGDVVLNGSYPHFEGVDAVYSPRRTGLDAILVDAARAAGADVVEGFDVTEIMTDGDRVTGVQGALRPAGRGRVTAVRARLVVGADGKHSRVARAVDAPAYKQAPARSAGIYTYWSGLPVSAGEMYSREGLAVGVWPTNDDLTLTFVGVPVSDFAAFRTSVEANMLAAFGRCGDLGSRIHAATRAEQIRATPDTPNVVRKPYGPGWALVGDAGLVMDPVTGQGIGHALRDAESLVAAVTAGLSGQLPLDAALATHHQARDKAVPPMYEFTLGLASFTPDPAGAILFDALARGGQSHIDQFLGAVTGAVTMDQYMKPGNLRGIVGTRGLLRMIGSQIRTGHRSAAKNV